MKFFNLSSKMSHTIITTYIMLSPLWGEKIKPSQVWTLPSNIPTNIFLKISQIQNSDHATMSFIMYGFFLLFFQYLHTQAKKKIVKHIRTCKPDHFIEKATLSL